MCRHKPREETPHYACSRSTLPFVRLQRHTVHQDFFAADLYWLARDAKDPDRCRNEIVGALLAPVRPGRIHDLARPPARRDADRYAATQLAGLSGRAFRSLGRVPRSIRDRTPEHERDRGDQVRPLEISPRQFTEELRRVQMLAVEEREHPLEGRERLDVRLCGDPSRGGRGAIGRGAVPSLQREPRLTNPTPRHQVAQLCGLAQLASLADRASRMVDVIAELAVTELAGLALGRVR